MSTSPSSTSIILGWVSLWHHLDMHADTHQRIRRKGRRRSNFQSKGLNRSSSDGHLLMSCVAPSSGRLTRAGDRLSHWYEGQCEALCDGIEIDAPPLRTTWPPRMVVGIPPPRSSAVPSASASKRVATLGAGMEQSFGNLTDCLEIGRAHV